MTEHRPYPTVQAKGTRHDYLPAAGRDARLPFYDLISRFFGAPAIHARLLDQAGIEGGQRVLEIGCGTGNLTVLAKRAQPEAEVVGSDPDPLALARAQRKARGLSGIRFERGYAQELPFPDGAFDRVLSALMLHHLDTDVKRAAAAEVLRVLRPGGRLHLVDVGGDMTAADGWAARRMLRSRYLTGNLGDGIPRLLRSAGFDCAEVGYLRNRRIGRVTFYRATRPA